MFGVARDNLVSADVTQVVHEDLLAEQVNQCLNICCHLLFVLSLFEFAEVKVRECRLEKLNVESVAVLKQRYDLLI